MEAREKTNIIIIKIVQELEQWFKHT